MKTQNVPLNPQVLLRSTVIAAAAMLQVTGLQAASVVYEEDTGNWATALNWTTDTVPSSLDSAFIRLDRVVTIDSNVGTVINVYLGQTNFGGTVVLQSGGSLGFTGNFEVMRQGSYSNIGGTLTMTGGTLSATSTGSMFVGVGGTTGTNSGSATISGGTLTAPITVGSVGGSSLGYFNVMGLTAAISGNSYLSNAFGTTSFAFSPSGISMLNYSSGTATFLAGSNFNIDGSLYTGSGGDFKLVDSSDLTWAVLTDDISISGFGGFTSQLLTDNDEVVLRLTPIPEPSGSLLILAAAPMLLCRGKRHKLR